jgi:hypothetical protein
MRDERQPLLIDPSGEPTFYVYVSDTPLDHDFVIKPGMCQRTRLLKETDREGLASHRFRLHRIDVRVPIRVNCSSFEAAMNWLARNQFWVDVDGRPISCGVSLLAADRVVVEFSAPPGHHRIVVSSQEQGDFGPIAPKRIVYVARAFELTMHRSA